MVTARETFLERVRAAVAQGNRAGGAGELLARGHCGYQGAGPDPALTFAEQLRALGGHCHVVARESEAVAKVLELVRSADGKKVLVGKGLPHSLGITGALRAAGLETWDETNAQRDEQTKATLFAADVGVTGVDWLIAETGTLVVTTRDGQARSPSLLPPTHVAVATRAQILPDLFDLFERLEFLPTEETNRGEGRGVLPACITLITGPSKTGDIELRLVTGVHGPGEVHVVLVA